MTLSMSSNLMSRMRSMVPRPWKIALLNSTSMRPHSPSTAAGARSTLVTSRRSIGTINARRPCAAISAAVDSRLPGSETTGSSPRTEFGSLRPSPSWTVRAVMATSNPPEASAIADALPMPRLAPVTSATGVSVMLHSLPAVEPRTGAERREWDSNPRRVAPHTLSKRADSAALASLPEEGDASGPLAACIRRPGGTRALPLRAASFRT